MDKPVLIGTSNPHKQAMLEGILQKLDITTVTLADVFDDTPDVNETGTTFAENAAIKACALSKLYDGYVVSTDGGVSIPGLGDKWNGLYTRRFAGPNATDEDRIHTLLDMAKDLHGNQRNIVWQEAVAIANGGKLLSSETYDGAKGRLLDAFDPTKYTPGMWVCSVWYVVEYHKAFFDLTPEERDQGNSSWHDIGRHVGEFFKK